MFANLGKRLSNFSKRISKKGIGMILKKRETIMEVKESNPNAIPIG